MRTYANANNGDIANKIFFQLYRVDIFRVYDDRKKELDVFVTGIWRKTNH